MFHEGESYAADFCERWSRKADAEGIDALTQLQRVALLPWWVKGIVDSGGFSYFYEGADLNTAGDVADALQEIGLREAAEACRRTREVFPSDLSLVGRV